MWAAQPVLALLTTCGTTAPRGLKAGTGADGSGDAAARASAGKELVGASEYPTDETLAEMVDQYEALVCWFYLPDGGSCDGGGGGSDGVAGAGAGGGAGGGGGGANEHGVGESGKRYGKGVACFVAYRDEGDRRVNEDDADAGGGGGGRNSKRLADLGAKRAAIAARARGRKPQGGEGGGGYAGAQSSSSSGDDSSDSGSDARGEEELDANDFEPGALRVRVILASAGTTQQLRKAAGAFLKTTRNRNPVSGYDGETLASLEKRVAFMEQPACMRESNVLGVIPHSCRYIITPNALHRINSATPQVKRNVLSAFALQDLSAALGVPKVLKALPPHIQVQRGSTLLLQQCHNNQLFQLQRSVPETLASTAQDQSP